MIISVLVFSECLGLLLGPEPNNEVIKSPKFSQVWETYCFCSVSYYYYYYSYSSLSPFFPRTMNLPTADLRNYWTEFHEALWSYRYMLLCGKGGQSHILRGSKGVGVNIESYGKVEISYINVYNL